MARLFMLFMMLFAILTSHLVPAGAIDGKSPGTAGAGGRVDLVSLVFGT
ncbi:MAG: hypothetical protein KDJ67_13355 [Nitratireductor sp.]|nr:hypothetical protein [Nitratireductor sp.]